MKKYFPVLCALLTVTITSAQSYQGYRTGNYTGVNGVFFNPANVVGSRYSWDVNLFSASALLGNDKASLRLKDAINSFDADSLFHQFTTAGRSNGLINMDVHGPSFMFNTGKKSAVAFTTRAVAIANITELDGALLNQIANDAINGIPYPYSVNMPGKSGMAAHGYTEYGVTYGRLFGNSKHVLKAAITAKYLAGAGNYYVQLTNFQTTINNDAVLNRKYFSNTTGSLQLGFGGIRFSDFEVKDVLKGKSSGIGGDIGFIYELHSDAATQTGESNQGRDVNTYILRLGLALQNLGSIRYNLDPQRSAAYQASITGTQRFYTNALENADIDSLKTIFDRYPQYFTKTGNSTGSYNVALPAILAIDADYFVQKGIYINAAFQVPLTSKNGQAWNTYQYFTATITPRFENRALGVFIPLSYHQLAGFTAGFAFRLGPLFAGSGSIINSITGKTRQADVFLGLHFGGLFQ